MIAKQKYTRLFASRKTNGWYKPLKQPKVTHYFVDSNERYHTVTQAQYEASPLPELDPMEPHPDTYKQWERLCRDEYGPKESTVFNLWTL